ncbi:hypothetical protein K469DRAFT_708051 [Zopfia rhizophila CBS 207.26]|uniref:Uncharacterized protein n=1 Tax=Zopfia rhizophila CBS 207.26 TaxID=1314779 RepID=A0A6A6E5X5_9PEZI|nr:hypothetical protein K469DRAFT_708051 [Zopfia rhizophila CBS 207.26]
MSKSTATIDIAHGWVSQPQGRGTFDIILSCLTTTFLCSWSALCLNVPEPGTTRWGFLRYKLRWQLFTVFFPEMIMAMAAEQWESANQSVAAFAKLGHTGWTMRHAFFADMGGFLLAAPDFPPFPVDGQQIAYLVEHEYLPLPSVTEAGIRDKNKADGFARCLTLVQIFWFSIQCIGRAVQRLGLTTFELSTIAFVLCTLHTFFFWAQKPLDVQTPIVLPTTHRIRDVLIKAGPPAERSYSRTPLDFLKPSSDPKSMTAPFWFGLGTIFDVGKESPTRPIRTFGNNKTFPPAGLSWLQSAYGILFVLAFIGIHLIGWNFVFPTPVERILWRIAALALQGLILVYLVALPTAPFICRRLAWLMYGKKVSTALEFAALLPRWAKLAMAIPVALTYTLARAYIILEGFISLRALPAVLFTSVSWSQFIPHL